MRVFYPLSARVNEFSNEPSDLPSGLTMLWSIFCLLMLALICSVLPSFDASASKNNSQYNQNVTNLNACANFATAQRDYVEAHRCAQ